MTITDVRIGVSADISNANSTLNALNTRIDRTKGRAMRMWEHLKKMDVYAFRTVGYISSIIASGVNIFMTFFDFVIGSTHSLLKTVLSVTLSVITTISSTFYLVSAAMTSGGATAYLGAVLGIMMGAMQVISTIMNVMERQNMATILSYTQSMFADMSMMMRF